MITMGTLTFFLFNEKYELSIETLGKILHLPTEGPKDVPNEFENGQMWYTVFGESFYYATKAKASNIQNPYFIYI